MSELSSAVESAWDALNLVYKEKKESLREQQQRLDAWYTEAVVGLLS